jgi:hypothetical protein
MLEEDYQTAYGVAVVFRVVVVLCAVVSVYGVGRAILRNRFRPRFLACSLVLPLGGAAAWLLLTGEARPADTAWSFTMWVAGHLTAPIAILPFLLERHRSRGVEKGGGFLGWFERWGIWGLAQGQLLLVGGWAVRMAQTWADSSGSTLRQLSIESRFVCVALLLVCILYVAGAVLVAVRRAKERRRRGEATTARECATDRQESA